MSTDLFESAVLRALGETAETCPLDRWAAVYAYVSEVLTRAAEDGRFEGPSTSIDLPAGAGWSPADLDAVWGLIYGSRTYRIGQRLLQAYPPPEGAPFAELGAGWGPFGLAAAELGRVGAVHLVDLAETRLMRARALFEAMALAEPVVDCADVAELDLDHLGLKGSLGAIAVAFALGEMGSARGVEWVRDQLLAWSRWLRPDGRIYIVDSGTRRTSRFVQSVRDSIADAMEVIAPCCGAERCPLLADERDWCHTTWRLEPGPLARVLADRARRRWQETHFSWLILGTGRDAHRSRWASDAALQRVIELRRAGKGKLLARLCGRGGAVSVSALRRDTETTRILEELEPGALVRFEAAKTEAKGDGLRLGPGALVEVARL